MPQALALSEPLDTAAPETDEPTPQPVRLRVTGRRAITFTGTLIGLATSEKPGMPFWYEIAIYRTVAGAYAAGVKLVSRAADGRDIHNAHEGETFDMLAERLEAHDCAADIDALRTADAASPLDTLTHRLRQGEAARQYRGLIGETLFAFDSF
jgi:hypothetical protein